MKHSLSMALCALYVVLCLVPVAAYAQEEDVQATVIPPTTIDKATNTMEYYMEDGVTVHSIYWTQGITPPVMSMDPELNNGLQGGYFSKVVIDTKDGKVPTYRAEYSIENNPDYYDLNKSVYPEEANYCYLVAAANILYWWMDQNAANIVEYNQQVNQGKFVRNVNPGITISDLNSFPRSTRLSDSEMGKALKNEFVHFTDGYFEGPVFDYFLNGYQSWKGEGTSLGEYPTHTPEAFVKAVNGGYFYPIFGSNRLVEAYGSPVPEDGKRITYDWLNVHLKDALLGGKGITLGYSWGNAAHAVALWGAEYDEQGNLCRIFYTDSDDYDENVDFDTGITDDNNRVGMKSAVVVERNGFACLDDAAKVENPNKGPQDDDPNKPLGAYVYTITFLDTAKDQFKAALDDINPLTQPVLTVQPQPVDYAQNATAEPLVVEVADDADNRSFLSYQWYKSSSETAPGTKIPQAIHATYQPPTDGQPGTAQYYYCEVTNNKNGKALTETTQVAKVSINDKPLVHAAMPKITKNVSSSNKHVNLYGSLTLSVAAESTDGGVISYQWYTMPGNIVNQNNARKIEGATSPSYVVPTDKQGQNLYYCLVTNTKSDVTGNKTATVRCPNTGQVLVTVGDKPEKPQITIQPEPYSGYMQNHVAEPLVVSAVGTGGELSYQWYKSTSLAEDGTTADARKIPGATAAEYVPDVSEVGIFYYYCWITNTLPNGSKESVGSQVAKVVVASEIHNATPPTITAQPQSASYKKGSTATELTLQASIDDGGQLTYQWYKALEDGAQGTVIQGATNASYVPETATEGDVYYYCVVTNTNTNVVGEKTATTASSYAKVSTYVVGGQVIQQELTDALVPDIIKDTYSTVESIQLALKAKLPQAASMTTKTLDIMVQVDEGGVLRPLNPSEIPAGGIKVLIPYPDGTGKDSHTFYVTHMITSGSQAGTVETLSPIKTDRGLQVIFTSFSPVMVAWEPVATEPPTPVPPTPVDPTPVPPTPVDPTPTPETDDDSQGSDSNMEQVLPVRPAVPVKPNQPSDQTDSVAPGNSSSQVTGSQSVEQSTTAQVTSPTQPVVATQSEANTKSDTTQTKEKSESASSSQDKNHASGQDSSAKADKDADNAQADEVDTSVKPFAWIILAVLVAGCIAAIIAVATVKKKK